MRKFSFLVLALSTAWASACGSSPSGSSGSKKNSTHTTKPGSAGMGSLGSDGAVMGPGQAGSTRPPDQSPTTMDGGSLTLPLPDARVPAGDSGRSTAEELLLRMVSVPPNYALASETMSYFPKLNASGDATMELVDSPADMTLADGHVTWDPMAAAAGDNDVTLDAALAAAKLSQHFKVKVGVASKLAEQDLSTTEMGQVAVTAPLSPIVGAAITVPAGALSQQTAVSISQLDRAPAFPNLQGVLKPVKFGPTGLSFLKPATVTLPYDKAGVADASKLSAYVFNEMSGNWDSVPVVGVDPQNALIMAMASHFSIYAAGASTVDTSVSLARMSAASTCEGELVGRVELATGWDAIEVSSINNRSVAIDEVLIPAGANTVQALLQHEGFVGTLRAVSVLELLSGSDPDRVSLGQRVLVTSVYVPGDGSAVVRHIDALGNVIDEHTYADLLSDFASIAARLSGAATHARFGVHADTQLALATHVHLLYAEGDATREAVSVDDLGVALVQTSAPAPGDPGVANDALDVDCDRLLGAYDASDDSAQPVVVASPEDVATVMQGQSLRLTASVLHASGTPSTTWSTSDDAATLTTVSDSERDFSASRPGRYQVTYGASAGTAQLTHLFAIDVLQPPAVNTAPSCTPTFSSGLVNLGDVVALSAALHDGESPDSALSVQWGLVDRSGASPVLATAGGLVPGAGTDAAFQAQAEGSFEIGCAASDGSSTGAIGSTRITVLAVNANLPPEGLLLTPAAATLVLGDSITLHASAVDRDGDALTFNWSGSADLATPSSDATSSSVVLTPAHSGIFDIVLSVTDQHSAALSASAQIVVVDAPLSNIDVDHDGFPAGTGFGTDCNDNDAAVNPAAHEVCGNAVDEDCDGVAASDDCDGDGYTVQQGDCDDQNRFRHPGATESCDRVDNDCNGTVDDGFAVGTPCSVGVGACQAMGVNNCSADGVFVTCWATPTAPAPEVCDQIDNNCDGRVDENGVCNTTCTGGQTFDPDRSACVCPPNQLWSASTQQCAASCPNGQVPVYGSQTCRAPVAGDTCASAIDLGLGGSLGGTLDGRAMNLLGCWSDTTSLRIGKIQIQSPGKVFGSLSASAGASVSLYKDVCSGQPVAQCLTPKDLDNGTVPPGLYYIVVGGEGAFTFNMAQQDGQGACSVPDGDGDGMTICDGDCDDHSATTHPGAGEICDGVDNDCNGAPDDLAGSCATGLSGICSEGRLTCGAGGGTPSCVAMYQPGQYVELCSDGRDNDCNGQTDENGCTAGQPGQTCALPREGGTGGTFTGTFAQLEPSMVSCAMPGDGHAVIHFDVPSNGIELGVMVSGNTGWTLWQDACGSQAVMPCGKGFWHQQVPPGSYLLELSGQGSYSAAIGLRDMQSGMCLTPDGDSDGITICNGDCDDTNPGVRPGAAENCDGVDSDCNGAVDDLKGSCATGLPGACGSGIRVCDSQGVSQCNVTVSPGQLPEYCGDGIDNNCNGSTDEAACLQVAPGEICSLAIDIGLGGSFSGDLTNASDDVSGTCNDAKNGPSADHVYRLTVPAGAPYQADFQLNGQVMASILSGGCGPGFTATTCFGSTQASGGGGSTGPNPPNNGFNYWFDPGTYYVVLEGTGAYGLQVSLRNSSTGTCLTPDADADGYALCNGDCNDHDPSVHPGVPEICDGLDNDCNGAIDDLQGTCHTGLPGVCDSGKPTCGGQGLSCAQKTTPGSQPELCADGLDNDCDGATDEQGCTEVPPGESCAFALDLGQGGSFSGSLVGASDDLPNFCAGGGASTPDRVYHLTVGGSYHIASIWLAGQGVMGTLFTGNCGDQQSIRSCIGTPAGGGTMAAMANMWLDPGDYFIVLEGTGSYTLSVGLGDEMNHCATPDIDADGYTVCNGDCNDADPTTHPNAVEACDMLDNDCNGAVDDQHQSCSTGQPGACDAGDVQCVAGMPQCKARVTPGQLPEYCSDALDNNCDGTIDEPGCTQVAAGELCSLPIDLGQGGTFAGNLTGASDDVSFTCDQTGPHADQVYRLTVPQGTTYSATLHLEGAAQGTLYQSGCGAGGQIANCFGSPLGGGGGGGTSMPAQTMVGDSYFGPGNYSLVVEGAGAYTLSVGLRYQGQCLTPDGDSDGYSLCNGDCDDQNPGRHPGVNEVCDGVDNDCNGMTDDVHDTCNTGLSGACAAGTASCSGGATLQCNLNLIPGQLPEYCGDGVDNNCNGQTDEAGCAAVAPGEVCWLPIDIGQGGHFSGDLSTHTHDVMAGCWGAEPDLVYVVHVPQGKTWNVSGSVKGAGIAQLQNDCAHPQSFYCYGPPPDMGGGGTGTGGAGGGGTGTGGAGGADGGVDGGGSSDGGVAPDGGAGGSTEPPQGWQFNATLSEGTYLWLVQGTGHFDLDFVLRDAMNGNCVTPDVDGDGFDVCQGDCSEGNSAVHPGAAEACDGIDNDCDGAIDDPHAPCSTGQNGACNQGHTACNGAQVVCQPAHAPQPEICADGVDNDCNGQTDESGCGARESCADALDVGPGGTFYGNLDNAADDVPGACSFGGGGDHVYRIVVPANGGAYGVLSITGNVQVTLYQGSCGGNPYDCSPTDRSFGWGGGTFYVVVKGSGGYALSLAAQINGSQCSVPDFDGDGHSICDRDCDEGNPSVYLGAPEVCDLLDNDCNGSADDVHGTCNTGIPGVCAQGVASCQGSSPMCLVQIGAGSQPDYCGDNLDNNCDGSTDEAGCLQVQPGEVCSLAIDMGGGGTFNGDLSMYTQDVSAGDCGSGADVVYKLNVPGDGRHMASVRVTGPNTYLSVFTNTCGSGFGGCYFSGSQVSLNGPGGIYYLVVKGQGLYTLSAAIRDMMDNSCSVPDGDGDGVTLCDNDCDDANPATHPGAAETCDGVDNDCNGPIDDLKGSCATGLLGLCAAGTPYCSGGSVQCNASLSPGQQPDYCGDNLDNNCDGNTDEAGCLAVPPGEVCSLAIPLGSGGTFSGDLSSATDDVAGTCSSGPDRIYTLNVPQGPGYDVRVQLTGAVGTLFSAGCDNGGFIQACYQSSGPDWRRLASGVYQLVVEGGSLYQLEVGLRDSSTGTCLTPDADSDGMTQCDNDCDDTNPNVHPGAAEVCGDSLDNDCDGIIDNCP